MVVRGFSFQKVPDCDWHGPRSHINRVGPIKTTDQFPAEIVQIGIEDGGNLRPLFVVAKNLAVANYSDNLAGLRIDYIALEHVFLVLRVRRDVYNSEFGALFRFPCYCPRMPRDGALTLSDVFSPTLSILCEPCNRHGRYSVARLVEEYGDAKLTDLLETLADCQRDDPTASMISARRSTRAQGWRRRRRCCWSAQARKSDDHKLSSSSRHRCARACLAAHAEETDSHVASTGEQVFRRFASLRIPLPYDPAGVRRCVQVRSIW